jgi:hypothetical protein
MEDQDGSPLRREHLETEFVQYVVRDKSNQRHEDISIDSLLEATDAYKPDADLVLVIGDRFLVLDVGRDMYGFHRGLLDMAERIVFELPSNGMCAKEPSFAGMNVYTLVLTDFYEPPVLCFVRNDKLVSIQTRTLKGDKVIAASDDVTSPMTIEVVSLVRNICSFLSDYLSGLLESYPQISDFTDYREYRERLARVGQRVE